MADARDIYLANALCDCVEDENLHNIRHLLDVERANPNTLLPKKELTPLHYIAGCDALLFAEEALKLFLQYGGDPNVRSSDGMTPVHVAAAWGHTSLMRLLMLSGGDPWVKDDEGGTAFLYAVQEKHWDVLELLQEFRSDDDAHMEACNSYSQCPKYQVELEKIFLSNGDIVLECAVSTNVPENMANTPVKHQYKMSDPPSYKEAACNKEPHLLSQKPEKCSTFSINCSESCSGCKHVGSTESIIYTEDLNENSMRSFNCPSTENTLLRKYLLLQAEHNSDTSSLPSDTSSQGSDCETCSSFQYMCSSLSSMKISHSNSVKCKRKLLPNFREDVREFDSGTCGSLTCLPSGELEQSRYNTDQHSSKNSESKLTDFLETLSSSSCSDRKWCCSNSDSSSSIKQLSSTCQETKCSPSRLYKEKQNMSDEKYKNLERLARNMIHSTPKKKLRNTKTIKNDAFCAVEGTNIKSNMKSYLKPEVNLAANHKLQSTTEQLIAITQEVSFNEEGPKSRTDNCLESRSDSNIIVMISDGEFFTCSSKSSAGSSSYFSVAEEYKYTDEENGIVLRERRILTDQLSIPDVYNKMKGSQLCSITIPSSGSTSSVTSSSVKLDLDYDTEALRTELKSRNCIPGPITKTTKRVYLRKLFKLKKSGVCYVEEKKNAEYCAELERTMKTMDWVNNLTAYMKLEQEVALQFSNPDTRRRWRGGISKSSFCYLLLDPRITRNLPCRADTLEPLQVWSTFLSAIFYIGKGVRARPYFHLYQAAGLWKRKSPSSDKKVQHILDIWSEGQGVVCLHVFQNVIAVEAYTREAAMIEAMGLNNLNNARYSEYYGVAASWNSKQKRQFGVYLLYRALLVFLNEGERQLRPENI